MNYSRSRAQGSSCYEKLKAMNYMYNFGLLAEGFKCYEQLRVVDDMNDSRS